MLFDSQQNRSKNTTTPEVDTANTIYQIGELFCGAGGLSLGGHLASIENCRFRHSWVNDIDSDSCRTISANLHIPQEHVHCCPVEELDISKLNRIDGLAFGFPCNDFSIVGEHRGIRGKFGGLYRWGVRVLQDLQPTFFVAENVGGIASSGRKRDLDKILSSFEKAGYEIHPHMYKFEKYGIPQTRHRIIIVGFLEKHSVHFRPPQPASNTRTVTCREALKGIPSMLPTTNLLNRR